MMNNDEFQKRFDELLAKLPPSPRKMPWFTFDHPVGDATPTIEIRESVSGETVFHYVISERGSESERVVSTDANEIFYRLFQNVTFEMACSYELKNRVPNVDSRRLYFITLETMLGTLNLEWRKRKEQEHAEVLSKYPFRDTTEL